jgi:ATP-dependent DNA ligase
MDKYFAPMLFKTQENAFDNPEYIYEIKWDGFRCLAKKEGVVVELISRNGWAMNDNFPEIVSALQAMPMSFIVDGELVVLQGDADDFAALQWRGRLRKKDKIAEAAQNIPATFIVFDILLFEGKDVTGYPLSRRKDILASVIQPSRGILVNEWIVGEGQRLFAQTKAAGREGIVAKRKDSLYYPGKRVGEWRKIKHWREEVVTIVGYKKRPDFGLLVTAAGKEITVVRQGLKPEEQQVFLQVADELKVSEKAGLLYMEPLLKCAVQFKEWTDGGRMRHPKFLHFIT